MIITMIASIKKKKLRPRFKLTQILMSLIIAMKNTQSKEFLESHQRT
jgi:hypothetical protein